MEFTIWKEKPETVAELMEVLREKFIVEGNKFHIVGFSANSGPIFNLFLDVPEYFHSITGIPGHPRTTSTSVIKQMKAVKVQNIVGEKDTYWLQEARKYEEIYEELDMNSILDIEPDGQHVLRHLVGKGFMVKMERMR